MGLEPRDRDYEAEARDAALPAGPAAEHPLQAPAAATVEGEPAVAGGNGWPFGQAGEVGRHGQQNNAPGAMEKGRARCRGRPFGG